MREAVKPNKKQQEVCKAIQNQAIYWGHTNDIASPTHGCDIGQEAAHLELFEGLTAEQAKEFEDKLLDLFYFVKKL